MKLVTAVVRPHALADIRDALSAHGVQGLTISEVVGHGRQRGHSEVYRGAEYVVDVVPKVRLEVIATDEDVDEIVSAIIDAARSGRIGDGKVWVLPVERLVRVRTGEEGDVAI